MGNFIDKILAQGGLVKYSFEFLLFIVLALVYFIIACIITFVTTYNEYYMPGILHITNLNLEIIIFGFLSLITLAITLYKRKLRLTSVLLVITWVILCIAYYFYSIWMASILS